MAANLGSLTGSFLESSKERLLPGKHFPDVGSDDAYVIREACLRRIFRIAAERISKWWGDLKGTAFSAYEMGRSDPRKVVFAAKMGTALSLVSVLIFFKEPSTYITKHSVWAILTVVVVFEFSIGKQHPGKAAAVALELKKCSQSHAVAKSTSHQQEHEAPQHPLQNNSKPGPKGAYEIKRVNNGLYIRVDMPGVPLSDDVKVNKKSDKCSITFYGKAPNCEGWPLDDSQRVYAGSISLDRDPDSIPLEKTFKNGCLRLFLSGADGNLCFLPNQESVLCRNPADEQVHQPDVIIDGLVSVKRHKPQCRCCKGERADVEERTITKEMSCINPSTLQGVRGVFGTKFVREKDGDGWGMYFRLDMPGFGAARMCQVKVEKKRCIIFGPMGSKEYPLDEGGRSYFCKLTLRCDCCCFVSESAVHELRDGVMRMWFRILPTRDKKNSSAKSSTSSSSSRLVGKNFCRT